MKSFIGNQESWFNERETEIAMKYKAKKESLRAQLRSKQTDQIDQLAAAIGLNSYNVFEDIKLKVRASEASLKEQNTSDDEEVQAEVISGLSKTLVTQ